MLKLTSQNGGKMYLTIPAYGIEIEIIVEREGANGLSWCFEAPLDVRIEREKIMIKRLWDEAIQENIERMTPSERHLQESIQQLNDGLVFHRDLWKGNL